MKSLHVLRSPLVIGLIAAMAFVSWCSASESQENVTAAQLIAAADVKGGLIIHAGVQTGALTSALRVDDRFIVQGLGTDQNRVRQAREHVRSSGRYGPISVIEWDGRRLPYVEGLVNLLVLTDQTALSDDEILRALIPNGTALRKQPASGSWRAFGLAGWSRLDKPRSKDLDEWTHYLHGPGNNAVAADRQVGPPRRLRWVGGPRYSRHHDRLSSVSAMVTASGRLFTIIDEASPFSILTPPCWPLVAAAADTGAERWRRDIHAVKGTLAAGDDKVVLVEKNRIRCLDLNTGRDLWHGDPVPVPEATKLPAQFMPTLVLNDGGLRLWRLDPATGEELSRTPITGAGIQECARQLNMPVALPDILSCDGRQVYMRSQVFALDGTRRPPEALPYKGNPTRYSVPCTQKPADAHLFSPTGFLDDTWWHRTYWIYGSRFTGGWAGYPMAGKVAPAGRIMAFDEATVYAFGREHRYYRWTTPIEHELYAIRKGASRKDSTWARNLPLFPRALLLTGDRLALAGPEDIVNEAAAHKSIATPKMQALMEKQAELLTGRHGGRLWMVNADTGKQVTELSLDTIPVFDGLAAARGRLLMTCTDGSVRCYAENVER